MIRSACFGGPDALRRTSDSSRRAILWPADYKTVTSPQFWRAPGPRVAPCMPGNRILLRWFGLCLRCNVQRIPCLAGAASKVRINELSRREGNVTARPAGRHGSNGSGGAARAVDGSGSRAVAAATGERASPGGGQPDWDEGRLDAERHFVSGLHPILRPNKTCGTRTVSSHCGASATSCVRSRPAMFPTTTRCWNTRSRTRPAPR